MKKLTRIALGALMLAGAPFVASQSASAANVTLGFSFGSPDVGGVFGSPCYGPGPCSYQTYYEPVFIDGAWYRGPIYYRWDRGQRLYYYHGAWRRDEWRGPRPRNIQWQDWRQHRGWNDGWRGDRQWRERGDNDRHDNRHDDRHDDRGHGNGNGHRDRDHDRH